MEKRVNVYWSDDDFTPAKGSVIVIIDALRATTTIPVALCSGAKRVIVVKEASVARELHKSIPNNIVAGERSGEPIEDFDCGNSPYKMRELAGGKDVILTTGNLCRVIDAAAAKGVPVIAGGMVNAKAAAEYVKRHSEINIVATGTYHMHGRKYDMPIKTEEDLIAGLCIVYELSKIADVGKRVFGPYEGIIGDAERISRALWETRYSQYLLQLDKGRGSDTNKRDMEICFTRDTYPCVPLLENGPGYNYFVKR